MTLPSNGPFLRLQNAALFRGIKMRLFQATQDEQVAESQDAGYSEVLFGHLQRMRRAQPSHSPVYLLWGYGNI